MIRRARSAHANRNLSVRELVVVSISTPGSIGAGSVREALTLWPNTRVNDADDYVLARVFNAAKRVPNSLIEVQHLGCCYRAGAQKCV